MREPLVTVPWFALFETMSVLLDKACWLFSFSVTHLLQLADRVAVKAGYNSKLSSRFPCFERNGIISPLGHLAAYCDGDEHVSHVGRRRD
jgi:hypothetical protein